MIARDLIPSAIVILFSIVGANEPEPKSFWDPPEFCYWLRTQGYEINCSQYERETND